MCTQTVLPFSPTPRTHNNLGHNKTGKWKRKRRRRRRRRRYHRTWSLLDMQPGIRARLPSFRLSSKERKKVVKPRKNTTEWGRCATYSEVSEVHNSPGSSSIASQNGKNEEPGDEDDKDVRDPYPGILEPRSILVHIRRLYNLLYIYSSDAPLARVLHHLPLSFLPAAPFCLRTRPLSAPSSSSSSSSSSTSSSSSSSLNPKTPNPKSVCTLPISFWDWIHELYNQNWHACGAEWSIRFLETKWGMIKHNTAKLHQKSKFCFLALLVLIKRCS